MRCGIMTKYGHRIAIFAQNMVTAIIEEGRERLTLISV